MASRPSTDAFLAGVKYRRTVYALNDTAPIPDSRVNEIVNEVMTHAPSSFNSQSTRLVVLLGEQHKKFWDLIINTAKPIITEYKGEESWERNLQRFNGFRGAYGTIVFAENGETVQQFQTNLPDYASMFPQWSEHASAMHQFALWTALELEGFGANLQHYNAIPGIEAAIQKEYGLPAEYSIKAQLVFGGETAEHPQRPEKKPVSETVKVVQ